MCVCVRVHRSVCCVQRRGEAAGILYLSQSGKGLSRRSEEPLRKTPGRTNRVRRREEEEEGEERKDEEENSTERGRGNG